MQCYQRPSRAVDICEPERTSLQSDVSNAFLGEQMLTWGQAVDGATQVCGPEPLQTCDTEVEQERGDTSALLTSLTGFWGLAVAGQLTETESEEEVASPNARDFIPKDGTERGQADAERYEARIAEHRASLAEKADGQGPEADAARAELDTLSRIDAAHADFSEVDLGNGQTVPVPYMVNYNRGIWPGRKTGVARKKGDKALRSAGVEGGERQRMRVGKGSADDNQAVLQGLLQTRPWESLPKAEARTFRRKLAAVAPEGVSGAELAAWQVLVYAQVAGYGTDCAGYVQQMLEGIGAVRGSKVRTGVGGLTKQMGDQVEGTVARGRGKASVARPVDAAGKLVVRPGDMMRMSGGGHIGLVHDVVDTGTEVILKVAHSTPDQRVHGTQGRMGTRTEGVREDILSWDRTTQRWKAVRCFLSSAQLNAPGKVSGFFRSDAIKADQQLTRWEDKRRR